MPSRVHTASLVDPASHSPAILELIDVKLDRNITEYLIDSVVETVDYALGRPSPSRRGRSLHRHSEGSSFATTVKNVLQRAEVEMPVVLATLVYLDRAKPHLHITLEEWANERVFLGALIVASKYLNDSSLKNVHWAVCTGLFGRRDIGRIEREFLDVLDWELAVSESDILAHHHAIMSLVSPALFHQTSKDTRAREPQLRSPASSCGASPSMSVSTDASFSPRTPPTLVNPEYVPVHVKSDSAHVPSDAPAPLPAAHLHEPTQAVHPPSKKHAHSHSHSTSGSSTLRLLRAFPLPHFGAHHPSEPQQQSNPNPNRCQPVLPPFPTQPSTQVCV